MLVRQLVEMHGGTVEARSDGAGKGSAFVVRLPADAAPVAVPAAGDVRPAQAPRRILVVDDNADIALALAALLELDGHDVRTAGGGEEALAIGARMRPEVILMDIGMPGMDGHEACRRIRECDWGRDISIVALTGWGQDGDRRDSARAGFDAHLVKPVGFAELHGLFARLA